MNTVHISSHPLIRHKIGLLRDKDTDPKTFRELTEELTMLLAYEATQDLPMISKTVETPVAKTEAEMLAVSNICIIPVLRAGLGMVGGMLRIFPNAAVGIIGLQRDEESHNPVEYYCKLPRDLSMRTAFIVDPMLATGGSAVAAVDLLMKNGCKDLRFCCMIAAPEGIENLHRAHPSLPIYAAALDKRLNEKAYIVPGLGDAGDRLFSTPQGVK